MAVRASEVVQGLQALHVPSHKAASDVTCGWSLYFSGELDGGDLDDGDIALIGGAANLSGVD